MEGRAPLPILSIPAPARLAILEQTARARLVLTNHVKIAGLVQCPDLSIHVHVKLDTLERTVRRRHALMVHVKMVGRAPLLGLSIRALVRLVDKLNRVSMAEAALSTEQVIIAIFQKVTRAQVAS